MSLKKLDQKILHFGFNSKTNIIRKIITLNIFNILKLFHGKIKKFSINLIKKKKSLLILGENIFKRISTFTNILNSIKKISKFSEILILYNKVNGGKELENKINEYKRKIDNVFGIMAKDMQNIKASKNVTKHKIPLLLPICNPLRQSKYLIC